MPPTRDRQATEIIEPLGEVFRTLRDSLDGRLGGYNSDLNGYWNTIHALLHASDQTMRASIFLVGDQRVADKEKGQGPGPFPAQAIILQRSLLEVLANVMALSENRRARDDLFRRDGYRENARRYQELIDKDAAGKLMQRKNSQWREALARWAEDLRKRAKNLKLEAHEIADPTHELRSWPRPPGMLAEKDRYGEPWLTGERLEVVQNLHDESYGPDSRVVHQKDRALYYNVLQSKGMSLEELVWVRNVPTLRALTLHAAVLAEVGYELGWPKKSKGGLRRAWSHLIQSFDPALEIYRIRYRRLLSRRE